MVPWSVLAESHPELARRGLHRLFEFGGGLAFLSTPQPQQEPRVQPAFPVLSDGRLYVLRMPMPVKRRVPEQRVSYALQAFPLAGRGSGDFYLAGDAVLVGKPASQSAMAWQIRQRGRPEDVAFELLITWALYSGWDTSNGAGLRAVRLQWHAAYQGRPKREGP